MLWSARCPAWRASDKWRTGVASITIRMQSSAGGHPRVDAAALAVQGGRRWLWAAWEASANRWRILRRLAMDVFSSSGMPCGAVPCDTVRCESSWFLGSRRAARTSGPVGDGSVSRWRRRSAVDLQEGRCVRPRPVPPVVRPRRRPSRRCASPLRYDLRAGGRAGQGFPKKTTVRQMARICQVFGVTSCPVSSS